MEAGTVEHNNHSIPTLLLSEISHSNGESNVTGSFFFNGLCFAQGQCYLDGCQEIKKNHPSLSRGCKSVQHLHDFLRMRALLQLLVYTTHRHLGPPYETNVLTVHRAWVLLKLVAGPDLNHAVLICMHEACTSFRAVKPSTRFQRNTEKSGHCCWTE